jgi:uncharacterized membrane protein
MSVETQNAIIGLVMLAVFMAATVPATAFFCRYRISRKKRVSCGTLFLGAFVVPFVSVVVGSCTELVSWRMHVHKVSLHDYFVSQVFTMVSVMLLCVLPALCVVVYYQRKKKRDEMPVA